MIDIFTEPKKVRVRDREVIRLSTSYWKDSRGVHIKKSILAQKRLSEGYSAFSESFDDGGDYEVLNIINLDEMPDGFYVIRVINIEHDWETNHVESWQYRLVPFTREEKVDD